MAADSTGIAAPAVVSGVGSDPVATAFLDRWKSMVGHRDPFMSYYQSLADILLPTQAMFTTKESRGAEIGEGIYDGTPRLALRDLATTLDGLLKPKTTNWFDVTVDDSDLSEQDDAKRWLEDAHERMWSAIYRKDARFIQRSGEVDLNLSCFGWGVLWIEENRFRNGLLFKSFHLSQTAIGENEDGIIDRISVEETMTPLQAEAFYRRLGVEPSVAVKDAVRDPRKAMSREMKFVQVVLPQDDYLASKLGLKSWPYKSALIDVAGETVVGRDGFAEFPAAVPRWETAPGEIYPRSPGMMALPDARTLQSMGKTILVGGQRAVDPPVWVDNDSIFSPLRTFPGGVTVVDKSDAINGAPIGAFPVSTNIPVGRELQQDYRSMVEAAFFKNVFQLPVAGPAMTAYEVAQRRQEFIRILGPVFGRLETDYIGHVAERVFGIMDRAGAFRPRPYVLQNAKITFRFQSPIQQARKQIEVASMAQALQELAPLAQTQPQIFDNFDGDQIARDAPEWSGMPTKWLRTIKDRDAYRNAAAQANSTAAQLAAAKPVSGAIRDIAAAATMGG
jgi:hypothetical protein